MVWPIKKQVVQLTWVETPNRNISAPKSEMESELKRAVFWSASAAPKFILVRMSKKAATTHFTRFSLAWLNVRAGNGDDLTARSSRRRLLTLFRQSETTHTKMMKPPVSGGFVMLKYGNMEMFLLGILQTTVVQLIGILGLFFILGFILSKLQEWTQRNYQRSIGWKGILWTAWIGTPFHELGHAFFVKLFRHQITRIALFQPNQATGELGQVEHRYNPASLYQKIGNFFIGAAPLIFGSLLLWLLARYLLPNGEAIFAPLARIESSLTSLARVASQALFNLFAVENLRAWNFWLFLYI